MVDYNCGLPVRVEAIVYTCDKCGSEEHEIGQPAVINHAIASFVANRKGGLLTPREVRFIRKAIGWSAGDMAFFFGVKPEVAERWESGDEPLTEHADAVLRRFAARGAWWGHYNPPEEYDVDDEQGHILLVHRAAEAK